MRNWFRKIFDAKTDNRAGLSPGLAEKARGDEFLAQGNWIEAERCYRAAIASAPDLPKAHSNLGFALARQDRAAAAKESLLRALELDPANADTHYTLGTLAAPDIQRFDEALAYFAAALRLSPDFEAAHVALCNLLVQQREFSAARIALETGFAHCPNCADLHRLQGELEFDGMAFAAAAAHFEQALAIDPADASTWTAFAQALLRLGRRDEAMAAFERGIVLLRDATPPDDAKAMFNLGAALMALGRYGEAQGWFEQSLALAPDANETRIARGWLRLLLGDFDAGWRDYREVLHHSPTPARLPQPLWDGKADLAQKSILLYSDQGMGDTLQLVRYVREIRTQGASAVYLDVQLPLRTLVAAMPGVTRVLAPGELLETFDFHSPLSNLPAAFGTTLGKMPDARQYIAAPDDLAAHWRTRLDAISPEGGALRVGVVWAGNPKFQNDRRRSMFLRDLTPVFGHEACHFYLLQKEVRPADQAELTELKKRANVIDLAGELDDFAATAAIVANLDVVITVDTSVAHLAGAMGKPVWILLPFAPDFRWLLDRDDSPWYPSARLFRQPRMGDWGAVAAALGKALDSATA